MNKGNLAAFFEDDEESPFPQKSVDDQKLSQYAQGTVRKSKREKDREAAEVKKREEEQEAARAYAEFVDAFEADGASRSKKGAFVKAGGQEEVYPSSHRELKERNEQTERVNFSFYSTYTRSPEPTIPLPKGKGKRAMDTFLEELKRDQADREDRLKRRADAHGKSVNSLAAYETQSGSKDRGDPATSNIFVANLPQHVTESTLGNFFARLGPVGSVKIMWPRGDASLGPGSDITSSRRAKSAGLSGFVSYMKRRDAEIAVREMDGFDWGGYILRVGWSKAVPVASKAAYGAERSHSRHRSRSSDRRHHSRSRSRSRSQGRTYHSRRQSRSRSRSRRRSPNRRRRSRSRDYRSNNVDPEAEIFIRTVANKVRDQGQQFENVLRERENGKAKFLFLWDEKAKHRYYRSLILSSRIIDPGFIDEGYNSIYSTDSAEESEKERGRKGRLGKLARRRFEAMLRALSGRRGELARCMAFSLEHADAASEVVDIIVASLLVDGTPVPRKVARLYLICDILHNSAASIPNAWKFRQEFQSRLGLVFDHLSTIYHSFPGRITADSFKAQILAVVEVWEDWIVFPAEHTSELRARLEGSDNHQQSEEQNEDKESPQQQAAPAFTSRFKASSFKPAEEALDGEESMDLDGESMSGENLDGDPMDDDDVDGEPIASKQGSAMDDVDGEPMDDVDGDPMD
ncbi:hypothetical protein K439DRAFT_1527590 [Ramaria rubella]|nr:hypothetical protein K439DRAFT_1527590 [Ramaria rubella]